MSDVTGKKQTSDLKEEIIRLGPWHLNVDVTPELSTEVFQEDPRGLEPPGGENTLRKVTFIDPKNNWTTMMKRIYPGGLEGRSFLEFACNCGGYCFWAKEIGAGECFGFDVRDHWINQANFLKENRVWPSDGITFKTLDLLDLPELGLKPFDVVMFQGIFYHLPDPITGLKIAADLTEDLLIFDTAIRTDLPDGMMAVAEESRIEVMSGVHGLNWFPTGPNVLERILRWMGFQEIRVVHWRVQRNRPKTQLRDRQGLGRVRLLASRKKGTLKRFESLKEPSTR